MSLGEFAQGQPVLFSRLQAFDIIDVREDKMEEMVSRSEWPVGRDVTMEFRCRRGSLVKVTIHASSGPIDEDEAISMATEAILKLAGKPSSMGLPSPRTAKAIRLDGGELFRSWAVPDQ